MRKDGIASSPPHHRRSLRLNARSRSPGSRQLRSPSRDISVACLNESVRLCRASYSGGAALDSHQLPGCSPRLISCRSENRADEVNGQVRTDGQADRRPVCERACGPYLLSALSAPYQADQKSRAVRQATMTLSRPNGMRAGSGAAALSRVRRAGVLAC